MRDVSGEEFAQWLRPADAIKLVDGPNEAALKAAIFRRLANGQLTAVARHATYDDRHKRTSCAIEPIKVYLWRHPWNAQSGGFWDFGDISFDDGHPIGGAMVFLDDDPADKYEAKQLIYFSDVRFNPVEFATEFERASLPVGAKQSQPAGRPRAAWWEDLLIEMARQLYSGDLKPENQAAIERAMLDWLSMKNIESSESAVRQRARTLFRAISQEDKN